VRHESIADRRGPGLDEHTDDGDGVGTGVVPSPTPEAASTPATDADDCVVFGIDFSPVSLAAARWATRHLARPDRALLVHVVPSADPDTAPGVDLPNATQGLHRELHRLRPALLGGLGGLAAVLRLSQVRTVVRVGSPSASLATLAASEDARLLVLGRRRDAARMRIGEPNVVERVARRAPCAVVVVPEGTAEPIEHVIAAVDGGSSAKHVVDTALRLARTSGAALTLLHVLSPSRGSYDRLVRPRRRDAEYPRDAAHGLESARCDAAYARLAWLARGAEPEVACRVSVAVGDAAREITKLAGRSGSSVVVVGKRGEDGAPAGSLGSVTRELLTRCPSPVIAIESPVDDPTA
jgi:universal stress protein A